ncbi:DUF2730 domain-containing protein [Actinobacillus pleuropneumoniae]|uniref:DUF2730 domain-containing protein n=1 Tax=Actinobacillus pleuropneumoniae TaxID=715 RepID=UPI002020C7F3|nr:DUF2730 domain-containing protein [Actinobacillus pleuropneumoniae]MCL7726145.1 DUF2730 domain-containing protein [Actinobacillus pleuropneumoniae]MCL7737349.1 DUF2730 domain-containing protein [Actinobacillus pleuropneumoniae]
MISEVFEFVRVNFGVISTLAAVGAGVFWLKLDSKYAKKNDVGQLVDLAKAHEARLTALETKVENLPSAVDMERLKTLVTDVKGDTKATGKQVDSISHQLGLLLEAKLKE